MPQYRVTEPGFYGGTMYSPDNRDILSVDKPFTERVKGKDGKMKGDMPSWVDPEPIKEVAAKKAAPRRSAPVPKKPEVESDDGVETL